MLRATTAGTSQLPKVVRDRQFLTLLTSKCVRATTACTFSTSQLPKVLRDPGVLYILTCKCASRHNGMQLFISHLASWLRTRRFSEPTFRPSGAQNHWKNKVFRDFPTFSRTCIFFLLTWSRLCFSSVHSVGSLTSKLPSTTLSYSILSYIYLSINLSIHLSIYPSICLSTYLTIYLSVRLSVYLSLCLSVSLPISLSLPASVSRHALT